MVNVSDADYGGLSEVVTFNDFEGGTNGTAISTANSGGAGESAWTSVTTGTGATLAYDNAQAYTGTYSAKFATGVTSTKNSLNWSLPSNPLY